MTKRPSCNKLGEAPHDVANERTPCLDHATVRLSKEGKIVDLPGFHEVSTAGLTIALCQGLMHNSPRK